MNAAAEATLLVAKRLARANARRWWAFNNCPHLGALATVVVDGEEWEHCPKCGASKPPPDKVEP